MNRFLILLFLTALIAFPIFSYGTVNLEPASTDLYTFENNSVLYNPSRQEYSFEYKNGEETVEYTIRTNDPYIEQGMISIRARLDLARTIIPLKSAGLLVRGATGKIYSTTEMTASGLCRFVTHYMDQGSAVFSYEETLGDRNLAKDYRISMRGKTLILHASSHTVSDATTGYIGFDFGETLYTPNGEIMEFSSSPYPVLKAFDLVYMSSYVDPFLSTTARYENTAIVHNRRNAQASNTPAWLIEGIYGDIPPLNITAYVTLSTNWKDVIPKLPTSSTKSNKQNSFILDLDDLPLAQRPYMPLEVIRKWTAPSDGTLKLKGTVALLEGQQSAFEIRIKRTNRQEPLVMYSQIFTPTQKENTGLTGTFPVTKGDELWFVSSSPEVMSDGVLGMNIEFRFAGDRYSSIMNYGNQQGYKGWSYQQKRGPLTTPLLWNKQSKRWESPDTRSWISPKTTASRMGAKGDAFHIANQFYDELNALGINNVVYGMNGWDLTAKTSLESPEETKSSAWGTISSLQELTKHEIDRGNLVVPHVSLSSLKNTVKPIALTQYLNSIMKWQVPKEQEMVNLLDEAIKYRLLKLDAAMQYNGLWLEGLPHPEGTYRYTSTLKWLGSHQDHFSNYEYTDQLVRSRLDQFSFPIFWEGDFFDDQQHWFWSQYADAVNTPKNNVPNQALVLDTDVELGNRVKRIGFGRMGQYFQPNEPDALVDARFNSMDAYLTATLSERRIPYLTNQYTNSQWSGHDFRKWLLESYALTKPVAEQYLHPDFYAENITYQNTDGEILNTTDAMAVENTDNIQRVIINYNNGLRIYANRSGNSWTVPESFLPVVSVKKDGFLAINERSGLISTIGTLGGNEYSAARTGDTFFLHSRDGKLMDVAPVLTDGMTYIRNSKISGKQDVTVLGVSELTRSGTLQPMIRASKRMDATIRWTSPETLDIWIFDAMQGKYLFEYYEIPQEWFDQDTNLIEVTRQWEHEEKVEVEPNWSIVNNGNIQGIRLPSAQGGLIYHITKKTAQETSMVK